MSVEESKVKAAYSSSNQAVSLSRSESFQHAVANDIVSVSSLPASNTSRSVVAYICMKMECVHSFVLSYTDPLQFIQ